MAPPGFKQMYVIHASLGESSIPVVFAFLERKNQAAYEELFEALNENWKILDVRLTQEKL